MKPTTCTNCRIEIEAEYCSKCGQRHTSKQLTFISIITDFVSNFFSMNKSGFATIWHIIVNPKKIVENYLLGYRNYYAGPGNVLLYGIAAISLHLLLVDQTMMDFYLGGQSLSAQYGFLIASYPYLMLVSKLSFKRQKFNFAEHLISITYCATSLLIPVIILCDLTYLITGQLFEVAAFWVFIGLTFFWNSRVFTKNPATRYLVLNTLLQGGVFMAIISIIVLLNVLLIKP